MAAYATQEDVLARAGRIGPAFSVAGRRPNLSDIDAFLTTLSGEVDEAVRSRGFDPTTLDAAATAALKDLVAYGALARALRGLNDRSPEVQALLVEADLVWTSAMGDPRANQPAAIAGSIRTGAFPVIAVLEAGRGGGGPVVSAGSFFTEEPDYGRVAQAQQEYLRLYGTNLAPGFSKGQKL